MERATNAWIKTLEREEYIATTKLKLTYTIYGCMLLLAHTAFESPAWKDLIISCTNDDLERLYALLAKHMKISHIAINKPIPPQAEDNERSVENVVRAPQNFTPVYGNFGSTRCSLPPSQEDFSAAFWVTAKQNDIYQTWAPRWTMFSRGNICEKARLLDLPSVRAAIEQGREDGQGCAAVDLYAGIGYFAFSYLKAGVDRVLCWDINAWSLEGLRKGAVANRWTHVSWTGDGVGSVQTSGRNEARLLIFEESNEHAAARVERLRADLQPIRHVNCGLLPTSRHSWETAVEILDRRLGGWVHVHENFAVSEISDKADGVRVAFEHILQRYGQGRHALLEDIHQVKSYAPGVMHCVLDIYIPPAEPS